MFYIFIMKTEEELCTDAGQDVRQETVNLLQEKGPKLDKVLLRLRDAINAKETKFIKIKGAISQTDLLKKSPKKSFELIASSGLLSHGKDGDIFGDGESLITCDMINHNVRLRAVDLALQLHDAMPSQKHEHTGKGGGPIETKLTNFPKEPKTITEWEQQIKEAEKNQTDEKTTSCS